MRISQIFAPSWSALLEQQRFIIEEALYYRPAFLLVVPPPPLMWSFGHHSEGNLAASCQLFILAHGVWIVSDAPSETVERWSEMGSSFCPDAIRITGQQHQHQQTPSWREGSASSRGIKSTQDTPFSEVGHGSVKYGVTLDLKIRPPTTNSADIAPQNVVIMRCPESCYKLCL